MAYTRASCTIELEAHQSEPESFASVRRTCTEQNIARIEWTEREKNTIETRCDCKAQKAHEAYEVHTRQAKKSKEPVQSIAIRLDAPSVHRTHTCT